MYVCSQCKILDGERVSRSLGIFNHFSVEVLVLQSLELHYQGQEEPHFSEAMREWLQREEETNINQERYFLRKNTSSEKVYAQ